MSSLRFAADGTPCCCEFDAAGNPIPHRDPRNACDKCQAHFAKPELRTAAFPSPDPYAKDVAAMRAASATEPSFEDGWKHNRTSELATQRDRMSVHIDAHPLAPRLTTAEVKSYAPPDPYATDVAKMRSEHR